MDMDMVVDMNMSTLRIWNLYMRASALFPYRSIKPTNLIYLTIYLTN